MEAKTEAKRTFPLLNALCYAEAVREPFVTDLINQVQMMGAHLDDSERNGMKKLKDMAPTIWADGDAALAKVRAQIAEHPLPRVLRTVAKEPETYGALRVTGMFRNVTQARAAALLPLDMLCADLEQVTRGVKESRTNLEFMRQNYNSEHKGLREEMDAFFGEAEVASLLAERQASKKASCEGLLKTFIKDVYEPFFPHDR